MTKPKSLRYIYEISCICFSSKFPPLPRRKSSQPESKKELLQNSQHKLLGREYGLYFPDMLCKVCANGCKIENAAAYSRDLYTTYLENTIHILSPSSEPNPFCSSPSSNTPPRTFDPQTQPQEPQNKGQKNKEYLKTPYLIVLRYALFIKY